MATQTTGIPMALAARIQHLKLLIRHLPSSLPLELPENDTHEALELRVDDDGPNDFCTADSSWQENIWAFQDDGKPLEAYMTA
ncbi:hypothetical protein H0H92_004098 [Tricholoma furcatifolium]|nr:hypothetical protein H0H92_004098 [Tricholoma furcatifolium]